jgi:electron transfer flavoprotein alpha subunit
MRKVLVYIDDEAIDDSIELLEAARRIYGSEGFVACGFALSARCGNARNMFDILIRAREGLVPGYDAAAVAVCMEELHRQYHFDAVLVPATVFGRMIAPRAAMRLGAGLVADITDLYPEGNEVVMVRPAFSGRLIAEVVCRGTGPVMMSVRPRTFGLEGRQARSTVILDFDLPALPATGISLLGKLEKKGVLDIRDSEVLISGGGGVLRCFPLLERLAGALHGMVSASRKAVDNGLAPRAIQVGQSGKYVMPRLYIALGISGSAQHVAGLRNAEYVISVNTDRYAPISSLSDIVVEGDARGFVEGLLNRIGIYRKAERQGTEQQGADG